MVITGQTNFDMLERLRRWPFRLPNGATSYKVRARVGQIAMVAVFYDDRVEWCFLGFDEGGQTMTAGDVKHVNRR